MPKDEFDFEDPLELNGVAFLTDEDTSAEMTGCFAEEFMRMGYNPKQVLALFRNPHYTGPNMVLANKGEPFVRQIIAETFARWGHPIEWVSTMAATDTSMDSRVGGRPSTTPQPGHLSPCSCQPNGPSNESNAPAGQPGEIGHLHTDPLGNPAPNLKL